VAHTTAAAAAATAPAAEPHTCQRGWIPNNANSAGTTSPPESEQPAADNHPSAWTTSWCAIPCLLCSGQIETAPPLTCMLVLMHHLSHSEAATTATAPAQPSPG
jgi:hypothetical protein